MLKNKRVLLVMAAGAATATLMSACSSSSSSKSGNNSSAGGQSSSVAASSAAGGSGGDKKPSGTPIKLGIIADVNTPVDFADDVAAARAAVRGVNSRGGINGHPVELDFCNGGLDPNKDAACVRKVLADKPMAMVGVEDVAYEANADKLFAAAGVANVSPVPYSADFTDTNTYLTSPGQAFLNAAQDVLGVKYDGKRQVLIRVDIPTTIPYKAAHQKLLPKLGGVFAGEVTTPEATGDLGPQAAALMQHDPDWVNSDATEAADTTIFKNMAQLGFKGNLVIAQDALKLSTIQSLGSLANRLQFASGFPPVTDTSIPGIAQFKSDMAAEVAAGDKDAANYKTYNRDVALEGYLGVIAVAKIANASGATDAASFKKAINSATNVDLGGIIPSWTPNKSVSKAVPRASTGSMYLSQWKDGQQMLLQSDPVDVTSYVDSTN
jgi:ABC-type branched-subunit amino acid transport system substrate-binding protein